MAEEFAFDVFLSHSSKDKSIVREVATLLRNDGLRVWFDEWLIRPGDSIPAMVDMGLEGSRVLVLFMSSNAFESDWALLESYTHRFNDPMNRNRRMVPLRLDDTPIKHSLKQFLYLPFATQIDREREYPKLLDACRSHESIFSKSDGVWNIPRSNRFFSGRETYLKQLKMSLDKEGARGPLAISGLGGKGKTQTAIEYARRHRQDYTGGFWISAEHPENVLSGFAEIARLVGIKEDPDKVQTARKGKLWLDRNPGWLLVLDNVETVADVKEWIPDGTGHVLITTQLRSMGPIAQEIDLPYMDPEEGAAQLLKRVGFESPTDTDLAVARLISTELGGLVLALEQAGAFIDETGSSPAEYLKFLQEHRVQLLEQAGQNTDHEAVTITFEAAFGKLGKSGQDIIKMCALLAPVGIPEAVLTSGDDPSLPFREAVADAAKFSLITINQSNRTVDIHRLVQEVTRDRMDPDTRRQWAASAIEALVGAFPDITEPAKWLEAEAMLPHVRNVTRWISLYSLESETSALLLYRYGSYLHRRAQYREMADPTNQAVAILEPLREKSLEVYAAAIFLQGLLRGVEGRYFESESLLLKGLGMTETLHGELHSNVFSMVRYLGQLYDSLSRHIEAQRLFERGLNIAERTPGSDNRLLATALNDLGLHYHLLGRFIEAEPLFLRALKIWEETIGLDHITASNTLNNIGMLYRSTHRGEKARPLYERALAIQERVLGEEHPNIAATLTNLALLLYSTEKRPDEAEPLLRRALAIDELAYGPTHLEVSEDLWNLADVCLTLGQDRVADSYFRRSSEILEKVLGIEHPKVLDRLHFWIGRYCERRMYRDAAVVMDAQIARREVLLGPKSIEVARTCCFLAEVYSSEGQMRQAESSLLRALAIYETALGPEHPTTTEALCCLGEARLRLALFEEAEALFRQTLRIVEGGPRPDQLLIGRCVANLAVACDLQKHYEEADRLYKRALKIETEPKGKRQIAENYAFMLRRLGQLALAQVIETRYRVGTKDPASRYDNT